MSSSQHKYLRLYITSWLFISTICFFVFDYRALGNVNMEGYLPTTSVFGSALQMFGCTSLGYLLARRGKCSFFPKPMSSAILMLLTAIIIVYLLIPEIRWNISDLVLYLGIENQKQASLYSSSIIRQLIVLRFVSVSAVLAFFFGFIANNLHDQNSKGEQPL